MMPWCFRMIWSRLRLCLVLLRLLRLLLLSHAPLGVELSQHVIHPRIRRPVAPGIHHAIDGSIRSGMMQDVTIVVVVVVVVVVVLRIAGVARRALVGAVGRCRVAARTDACVGKRGRRRM